jgi:hypothetical protein
MTKRGRFEVGEIDDIRAICGRSVGSARHTFDVQFWNVVPL